jgi:PEP-CTERM motif
MKLRTLLTTFGCISLAITLPAQVIGDFEGALDPGWALGFNPTTGAPSTTWASTGSYSLAMKPSSLNAFSFSLQFNDLVTAQKLASTHKLQFDVHFISSEWTDAGGDGYVRWDIASLNSDTGGWSQLGNANITDPANPSYPGSWDPNNWGASHTRTLTYDFTGLGNNPGGGWGQFNLSVNMGNIEAAGNFYIDNVRLVAVPEPSTLALAGLSSLALMMARRRK